MKERLSLAFRVSPALALLFLWQSGGTVRASSITGVFSNPVLIGDILNDPSPGQLTPGNNSGTAVFSLSNGGSTLTWGMSATVPANEDFSALTFSGSAVPANPGQQFQIGTISFLNGTSDLDTLVFGATLSFYENGDFLGSDNVVISTTSNQFSGTALTQAQLAEDADYINICGNNSNICAQSLEAYEDSEGGVGVTANLFGSIVGDPTLILSNITAPGQSASGGIVGNLPALGQVPEPSSVGLLSAALLCGVVLFRRTALRQLRDE